MWCFLLRAAVHKSTRTKEMERERRKVFAHLL
jgi:hypothetical protein